MPVLAEYRPVQAPGANAQNLLNAFDQTSSLMERKQRLRMAQENHDFEQAQAAILLPLQQEKTRADMAKAKTDYQVAMRTQAARDSAYQLYDTAATDFNYVNQITDAEERANASREWLSRYSQLSNIKELAPQIEQMNNLAAGNIEGLLKVRMLGTAQFRSFEEMTKGLTPEKKEQAREVELGIRARPSSAAITYREVIGPDGRAQLVAVDPRAVGAQIVGSGVQYGSGVGETPESRALAQGQAPSQPNQLIGQTPYDKANSTTQGTKDAEYQATLKAARPKREMALKKAEVELENSDQDIEEIIDRVTVASTGPGGAILKYIPATEANKLYERIDSLKSRLMINGLQAMREASPTGGALGNVTDREGDKVAKQIVSLDPKVGPTELISNLRKLQTRLRQQYGLVEGIFNTEYGSGGDGAAQTPVVIKSIKRID